MTDVFILGIGMTGLGKFPNRSVKDLTREAVDLAIADADIEQRAIQAVSYTHLTLPTKA